MAPTRTKKEVTTTFLKVVFLKGAPLSFRNNSYPNRENVSRTNG
jgi:hypothetical protein